MELKPTLNRTEDTHTDTEIHPLTKAIFAEDVDAMRVALQVEGRKTVRTSYSKVKKVRKVESPKKQFVYDIGMRNEKNPWFFGNNMLLHNSVYFTAWPALESQIESGEVTWSPEKAVALYDEISEMVSDSFPQWMNDTYNVPIDNASVIKSAREIVASTGLFIKKKRYAAMVIDKDGKRQDIGGKLGKIKAMGLDLRRADTPKFVQEFLMTILTKVLLGSQEDEIIADCRAFKDHFNSLQPWQRGIPKGVNRITHYQEREEEEMMLRMKGKASKGFTVPGHVRGAINWNQMLGRHNDLHTTKILDGSKVIMCYLKETEDSHMTNIAYPVDELKLPEWFTSLPFDTARMEETVVDNKVRNLLAPLKWDLARTSKNAVHMESLFDFTNL